MSKSSINDGISASDALRRAGQVGNHALFKVSGLNQDQLSTGDSFVPSEQEQLDTVFKQHPDLFKESSPQQALWNELSAPPYAAAISTLFIREHQSAPLIREFLLSDPRLYMCAMAERLGDACRQIRKQSYAVIVLAVGEHMRDLVSMLDLMNTSNPRAKAVAVIDHHAISQLQNMMHPKVLGYVAAQDAEHHLADAVVEVSQGRFTASPNISEIMMRMTTNYLAEHTPSVKTSQLSRHTSEASLVYEASTPSEFGSSTFTPSHLHSSFVPSTIQSDFGEVSDFSRKAKISTATLSERESAILLQIAGGLCSAEIGRELAISVPTVNTHIRNIFMKLGVHTRAQAIHVGIAQGMIEVQ